MRWPLTPGRFPTPAFSRRGGAIAVPERCCHFGPGPGLTDYPSPLGSDLDGVAAAVRESLPPGTRLALDSLPLEAAEPLMKQFAAVGVSLTMPRGAAGAKGGFMTVEMEHFFGSLVDEAGAVVDVLCDGDGATVGAAFGFEDADTYYLYNSAFHPD